MFNLDRAVWESISMVGDPNAAQIAKDVRRMLNDGEVVGVYDKFTDGHSEHTAWLILEHGELRETGIDPTPKANAVKSHPSKFDCDMGGGIGSRAGVKHHAREYRNDPGRLHCDTCGSVFVQFANGMWILQS